MKIYKIIGFLSLAISFIGILFFSGMSDAVAQEQQSNSIIPQYAGSLYRSDSVALRKQDSLDYLKYKKEKKESDEIQLKKEKLYLQDEENKRKYDSIESIPDTIYGKDFFRQKDVRFYKRSAETAPPENYRLGPGDEISISIWGASEYEKSFIISEQGYIQPSLVGRILLKGKTYAQAREIIKSQFSKSFDMQRSEMAVYLSAARTIGVNVVGEVKNPGTFEMPAVNSAFNVLMAAQGLNNIGSVRSIYIQRGGKLIDSLDVYRFLQDPGYNGMKYLEDGDYVFVPARKIIAKVEGYVNRPMWYELKPNETLKELISFAGGFRSNANQRMVQVYRYENNQRIIIDVDLQNPKTAATFKIKDGDLVKIAPALDRMDNFVEITGPVYMPGKYQFRQGMRVLDLINKAQGFTLDFYGFRANLYREVDVYRDTMISIKLMNLLVYKDSAQNLMLRPKDRLYIFSKKEINDSFYISVEGAVRKPGYYPYADNMSLKDVLFLSGGLTLAASPSRIEVARIVKSKNENGSQFDKVSVSNVVISGNLEEDVSSNEFKLLPFDKIYVRSNPDFKLQKNVYIGGEVLYPGKYSLMKEDEKLSDLLERAGGLTPIAFSTGCRLYRAKDSIGFVYVDFDKALKKRNSVHNYSLRDSDSIYVPVITQLVRIRGEMNNIMYDDFSVPFKKGKKAKYYIKLYGGGFSEKSNIKQTYVILPNMGTRTVKKHLFWWKYPKVPVGSTIVIPMKEELPLNAANTKKKEDVDWEKFLKSTLNTLIAVFTLVIVVQQVSK